MSLESPWVLNLGAKIGILWETAPECHVLNEENEKAKHPFFICILKIGVYLCQKKDEAVHNLHNSWLNPSSERLLQR